MNRYTNYPQIWKPPQSDNWELFIVRLPAETSQLTRLQYKAVLSDRIVWLIQSWMEQTQETQEQIHRRLAIALNTLLSYQEVPRLTELDSGELVSLTEWMDEWAETFIDRNETLMQKLSIDFPVSLPTIEPQFQKIWLNEHNKINLANWLETLTYGMSEEF